MRKLVLHFVGDQQIELFETLFTHPVVGEERRCIRGKRSGAYRGYSTFQWTKAVQALSLLMVEACIRSHAPSNAPLLTGGTGSFASSLDYAIDKQTTWLFDMFGWDSKGGGLSRRLFIRSNPGQRLPGPVALSLNLISIGYQEIEILLNYEPVTGLDALRILKARIAGALQGTGTTSGEEILGLKKAA